MQTPIIFGGGCLSQYVNFYHVTQDSKLGHISYSECRCAWSYCVYSGCYSAVQLWQDKYQYHYKDQVCHNPVEHSLFLSCISPIVLIFLYFKFKVFVYEYDTVCMVLNLSVHHMYSTVSEYGVVFIVSMVLIPFRSMVMYT